MKAILTIVTLLGLAAATTVYGAQQTGPATENEDRNAAQERERSLDRTCVLTQEEHHAAVSERESTPALEPSGVTPAKPMPPEQMMRMMHGMHRGPNMPEGEGTCPNCPMHEGMHHEMHHSMHHR